MQYSTALSDGALTLACFACVFYVGRARKRYGPADQPALFCALLGFLLPAAAATVGALRYGVDPDWQAAHLWLTQASRFLAWPLLGAAALALSRGWAWSRPNWGRILLGLCAFFELFRQMNQLETYQLVLDLTTLLLILYAGAVQWPRRLPLCAALAAITLFALAGQAVGTEGLLGSIRRIDLFHGLLALAYPLLAWLILALPGTAAAENPVKTL
ncbi:DUF6962 family protein [Pseudomonas borbori]